ncbi:MAG: L-lysine 6-transaminase [Candidatus Sumerlaeia bacterium]|nr:L-lysine 6-transaminase [Candidatus Sumerlaeia bacterium]
MAEYRHPIFDKVAPHVVPVDPMAPVIDFNKSQGSRMYDLACEKFVIDFASHYASLPLGYNHPDFFDAEYEKNLLEVSRVKIANLDVLSAQFESFLSTFRRVAVPEGFGKLFFISGGGLAVENALKAAFDWKAHRNTSKGKEVGRLDVIHFRQAFHGRTGYTMSVTNTDPNKTRLFPKFDWPRVPNPKMRFPMEGENLEATLEDERSAMSEISALLEKRADDISCILVEPIQGEGGDNHFRPEFLKFLRKMADKHDVLLIFDEVQTGMGMTGNMWAFQGLGMTPDLVAFAKKAQVGGFMAGPRIMEEAKNVFTVPSRISSTWGGSLTDMVRCQKYLEIIEKENLVDNARERGAEIMEKLHGVANRTELITNVRGSGLFIAFDLVYPQTRGTVLDTLYDNGLMCLVCGEHSMRFRPHLNVTSDIIDEAIKILEDTLNSIEVPVSASI